MAKTKINLSVEEAFKEDVRRIGQWMLAHGLDVEDRQHGGVSISKTLDLLVSHKLREIDNPDLSRTEQ